LPGANLVAGGNSQAKPVEITSTSTTTKTVLQPKTAVIPSGSLALSQGTLMQLQGIVSEAKKKLLRENVEKNDL